MVAIDGLNATVDFFGVRKELRLDIVDEPVQVGDYVLNHVGFAIRRIPPEEVQETLALFDQILDVTGAKAELDLNAVMRRLAATCLTVVTFIGLLPAAVEAQARAARPAIRRSGVLVSSSTVALQNQYAEKDAPSLQRLLPLQFTFAVAKGRRRYACVAKLQAEALAAGQGGLDLVDAGKGPAGASADDGVRGDSTVRELAVQFDGGRWNGDRDELALPVTDDANRDHEYTRELGDKLVDTYHRGIGPMLLEPAWRGVDDPIEKVFSLLAGRNAGNSPRGVACSGDDNRRRRTRRAARRTRCR